mmetsp:Transcript_16432/g.25541  ORF Transcript_16432/g.25541 Transcript_16432/m.25541 type:complete len:240 (-) Transcript_16432:1271-1990(-)
MSASRCAPRTLMTTTTTTTSRSSRSSFLATTPRLLWLLLLLLLIRLLILFKRRLRLHWLRLHWLLLLRRWSMQWCRQACCCNILIGVKHFWHGSTRICTRMMEWLTWKCCGLIVSIQNWLRWWRKLVVLLLLLLLLLRFNLFFLRIDDDRRKVRRLTWYCHCRLYSSVARNNMIRGSHNSGHSSIRSGSGSCNWFGLYDQIFHNAKCSFNDGCSSCLSFLRTDIILSCHSIFISFGSHA